MKHYNSINLKMTNTIVNASSSKDVSITIHYILVQL
jgi:hypothetical protein